MSRWLRAVFAVTVLTLLVDVAYLYGEKFRHAIHSDAAATVLMADRALHAHAPIFRDWYYGNGEVWFFAPHLVALIPVALVGVSPNALLIASLLGFGLEMCALVWAYRRLSGHWQSAAFAAALTLMAWSRLHVLFVYIELGYGLFATFYAVLFSLPASLLVASEGSERKRSFRLAALGVFLAFAISLQSPPRGLVFAAAPVLVGCVWPWRAVPWKRRVAVALGVGATYVAAYALYELWIKRVVTFSIPSGHNAFELRDLAGMKENVENLGRGLAFLAGEQGEVNALVVAPLLFMLGSLVLVLRHVFSSWELTTKRFACVAAAAQFAATVLPLIAGNLVINPWSVRYLIPSLLLTFGLASVLAVEALANTGAWRRAALVWLVLAPLTALLSLGRIVGSYRFENDTGQWANREAHAELAAELSKRGLTHGFSTYWNANLVTLLSRGETLDCPVNFGGDLLPYKWNTRTACFERSAMPARFYLAVSPNEHEAAAKATEKLPAPTERFTVGSFFDVSVYETGKVSLDWMDIPVADGENLRLPLHMNAAFPQLRRVKGEPAGDRVVATGEEGCVVFGPYMELPKGRYVMRWIGSVEGTSGDVGFDVLVKSPITGKPEMVVERAASVAALPHGAPGELIRLQLDFKSPAHDFEARVFSRGGAKVTLDELVLDRP